jgi:hypothetical protein
MADHAAPSDREIRLQQRKERLLQQQLSKVNEEIAKLQKSEENLAASDTPSPPGINMQVSEIATLEHQLGAKDQDHQVPPLAELAREVAAQIVSEALLRAQPEASLTLNPHPIAPPPTMVQAPVWPVIDLTGEASTSSGGTRPGGEAAEEVLQSKTEKEPPLTAVKIEGGINYSPHPPRSASQLHKSPSPLLQLTPQSDPFWHSAKENWDPDGDCQQYGEEPPAYPNRAKSDPFEPRRNDQ